jgi:diguanylate cyclase (GGDEF)-like protein
MTSCMRRSRSPEVLTLAAFLFAAAAVLVVAVLFPMTEQAPVRLGYVMIAVALAMAIGTLFYGDRWPRGVLLVEAAAATVLNSILVAYAHTTGGAMGDAIAYAWLTLYVAWVFPRFWAPFALLVAAGFGVGVLAADLPGMVAGWALVSLTMATIGAVVSRVSLTVNRHLATDTLTGALNRRGLRAAADSAIGRARRRSEDVTLAALDLDDLKRVNDADGHAAGDRLLADTTSAWRKVLRDHDVLARTGGDEFVLIMPGTSPDEAETVLSRLREVHPAPWSAGVARWRPGESLEACLERADERLYAAKTSRSA